MKISYIPEKKLKFGHGVMAFDPRIGLLKGGPFGPTEPGKETEFKIINCGIIGTPKTIAYTKNFIQEISFGFGANESTYGDLGFPGLGIKSPLHFSLRPLYQWESAILDQDIKRLSNISDKNEKKDYFIDLIEGQIQKILNIDPNPNLLIVSLDEEILNIFQREGIETNDIIFANRNFPETVYESNGDINFHSILKILGMKYKIPTQLLKPETVRFTANEDKVTTSWNFSVAQYYKADGIPWKFSELDYNVCFIGISFFRDFSNENVVMNTSMAQVFLYTGESFILKGDSFEWTQTKYEREPHLETDNAKKIIDKVLNLYRDIKGCYPSRIVIHKTSDYYDKEIEGFYQNKANIEKIDMITINPSPKIRFYRRGKYPVIRGTLVSTFDNSRNYLYTYGYIPSLKTYPGMRAPIPIEVKQFTSNSDIKKICSEILILSRLDWNNIKYCQRMPVTLKFSKLVGDILAERRATTIQIQPHYRYYM